MPDGGKNLLFGMRENCWREAETAQRSCGAVDRHDFSIPR
jgi:hypothetical protein